MNYSDVLNSLILILGDFWIHHALIDELVQIVAKTGYEAKFFNLLLARLKYLQEYGAKAIEYKEFEILTDAKGLYSMHLSGTGFNVRVLYSFSPEQIPVLLVGFYKKSGKKKTDYTSFIPIAQQRLSEELEAHSNEQK